MPFVEVGGNRIHYIVRKGDNSAQGQTIVFVHGAAGNYRIWLNQLRFLSQAHTAIALDLPGHGDSQGNGSDTVAAYREAVKSFADALKLPRFVLCGHSMGGGLALDFALRYPERLAGIISISGAATFQVDPKWLALLRKDPAQAWQLSRGRRFSKNTPQALIQQVEAEALKTPVEVAVGDFTACGNFNIVPEVKRVKVPALFICGIEDRLLEQSRLMHAGVAGSRLEVVQDAAHVSTVEQPEAVNRAISDFLSQLPA